MSDNNNSETKTVESTENNSYSLKKQLGFLKYMINVLPTPYQSQEVNRLTLLYFVIGSLEILDELKNVNKQRIIDFVYNLQVLPDKNSPGF